MKILIVLNSSTPGGMEQHVLDLVNAVSNLGHSVYVWCPEGGMSDRFKDAGGEVINMEIKGDIDVGYIVSLAKFIKSNGVEIIHSHELKTVVNSFISAVLGGVKIRISHTHTPISEWKIGRIKRYLYSTFYSFFVNCFSTFEIALTESRKRIKIEEGILERKVIVISNGVKTSKFEFSDVAIAEYRKKMLESYKIPVNSFVIGYVSRMSEEKGHEILIDAFSRFIGMAGVDSRQVCLLLAGGGKKEKELRLKVDELGLSESVKITGVFKNEDREKVFAVFDLFVSSSLAEGFGIVLLEAMASALPIVCSDIEVFQEVGDGTVLFFETGNAVSLSEKLFSVYSKRENLDTIRFEARTRVKELFSIEKFERSYVSLYERLFFGDRS